MHLQCHCAPQLGWSVHAMFQQTCAWEHRAAVSHACCSSPSAHWCFLQPVLTLPCLQPHTLVLVACEGETMLQRSTGLCPSLSWGELVLSWSVKHPVTQLGSAWVGTRSPTRDPSQWVPRVHRSPSSFGGSCEGSECWSSFFGAVLCYFWQESKSNLKDFWSPLGTKSLQPHLGRIQVTIPSQRGSWGHILRSLTVASPPRALVKRANANVFYLGE